MKQGLSLRVSQHLALTPQLQQSIRLLQLSTLELNQEVPYGIAVEVEGIGEASINQIKLLAAAASRVAKGEIKRSIALSSWNDVIDYCRAGNHGDSGPQVIQSEVVQHDGVYPSSQNRGQLFE